MSSVISWFKSVFLSVRKFFDTGGVDIEIDAPSTFGFTDDNIPVQVTLTGHESETRTINSLVLRLTEQLTAEERKDSSKRRRATRIEQRFEESITLSAGEIVSQYLELKLNGLDLSEVAEGMGGPDWLQGAAKAIQGAANVLSDTREYRISAGVHVDGFRTAKSSSRKIRSGVISLLD